MKTPISLSRNSSVLFATFSAWENGNRLPTNGSVEPLRDFLVPKIKKLVLIDQLVPGSREVLPRYEIFLEHNSTPKIVAVPFVLRLMAPILGVFNRPGTQVVFKVRDFVSVVAWAIANEGIFEYCIGLESINAIAGIFLRMLGKVKKVVYYVSDYSPNRYPHTWFNAVYLWLDKFAAVHSDVIWDVSRAIQPARIAAGLDPKRSAPVIHVANGLFPEQIIRGSGPSKDPHAIAYMGTLGPENGPDVAIQALSLVRKSFPDATLHMIGGRKKDFLWLRPFIQRFHLKDAVIHYGFIPKSSEMARIMHRCAVGVAPYRSISGSPRYYGDAGKIRAYCASGLAVVSSEVPPLGREVADCGAGLIVPDDPRRFAAAITKIFTNQNLYNTLRRNAREFAKSNTWENQFTQAFLTMQKL